MRRLRELQMMAGIRKTRAERTTERQIARFRRQQNEAEQAMLLIDKIKQREQGAQGEKPMPYAQRLPDPLKSPVQPSGYARKP